MKKKLLIAIISLPAALVLLLIVGMLAIKSVVTKELLVDQMESAMNLRADVKELNISLFSVVSSIELRGVRLAPRDRFADAATPLKDRPQLKSALISAEAFDLKFSLGPLLQKRFELKRLVLNRPEVNLVLFENGGNNLSGLFTTPRTVAGKRNPALDNKAETKPASKPARRPAPKSGPGEKAQPFTARDLPVATKLDEIGMKNATVNIRVRKTGQLIRISGLTTKVDDIDINPEDLVGHNKADVRFDMNVSIIGRDGQESAALGLRSGGRVTPFEPKTGRVNPFLTYALTVRRGSFVDGMPLLKQLGGAFPLLEKAGLKMEGVGKKAELQADTAVRVSYGGGRVTFLDDIALKTMHYDLSLNQKSWIQTTNNEHLFRGSLLASKEESARAVQSVDARLEKALAKAQGVDKAEVRRQLLGGVLKGDQIALPFTSSGNIQSPTVRLGVGLPSIADLLKGQAGNLVKGRLNDALNKNPKAQELMKKLPKLPF